MSVYVDDVRHRFGRMIMCHMWADSIGELLAVADKIGTLLWLCSDCRTPPDCIFDIPISYKSAAIAAGAILTDRYGPVEFLAKREGDQRKLDQIAAARDAGRLKERTTEDGGRDARAVV